MGNNHICPYDFLISKRRNIFEKLYIRAAQDLDISVKEEGNHLVLSNGNITRRLSNASWLGLNSTKSIAMSENKNRCTEMAKKYFSAPGQLLINHEQDDNYQSGYQNFCR
jgi:hypothetical protein